MAGRSWRLSARARACLLHATYLLPAAMLTLTYMYLLSREGKSRTAMLLGVGSLAAVLPIVVESA